MNNVSRLAPYHKLMKVMAQVVPKRLSIPSGYFQNRKKGGSMRKHAHSLGVAQLQPRPHSQKCRYYSLA